MCRLMGYVSHEVTTFPRMAGGDFQNFVDLSSVHCDGWGVATIDHGQDKAQLVRAAQMAHTSAQFDSAISSTQSDGGLLHLRWATAGLPVSENNTHPFVYQDFTFIHNGSILPPSALDHLIDPEFAPLILGQTDSERYFYFLMTMIKKCGFVEGVRKGVKLIMESCDYSSINAMVMNEDTLVVVRENNPNRQPEWATQEYYELKYRKDSKGLVVASSGWNQEGWIEIPNHSMLSVDRKDFSTQSILLT